MHQLYILTIILELIILDSINNVQIKQVIHINNNLMDSQIISLR